MRFPWIASIFTLCGLAVLCTLGTWQLQRLEWKEKMLLQIEQGMAQDPAKNMLSADDLSVDNLYQLGTLRGVFDHDHNILLGPKTMRDGLDTHIGFHLISPLRYQGENGQARNILVNRGFISQDDAKMIANTHIGGEVILSGMIAPIPRANIFTPENDPPNGLWFSLDKDDVQSFIGQDSTIVKDVIFIASLGDDHLQSVMNDVSTPKNNHLQYALFWFTMALALLGVYILRFVIPFFRR